MKSSNKAILPYSPGDLSIRTHARLFTSITSRQAKNQRREDGRSGRRSAVADDNVVARNIARLGRVGRKRGERRKKRTVVSRFVTENDATIRIASRLSPNRSMLLGYSVSQPGSIVNSRIFANL